MVDSCPNLSRSSVLGARLVAALAFILGIFPTTARASVSEAPVRVMILPIRAEGADVTVARQLDGILATEVSNAGAYEVVTQADIKAVLDLEANRQSLGCDADSECLARVEEAANAELVIAGSLGTIGRERVLTLTLIQTRTAVVKSRVSGPISDDNPSADVSRLAAEMLGASSSKARFKLPKDADLSFAVLDLEAAGVDRALAKNLTQILSTEVKRIEGATVIGRDDVAAMLQYEADKQNLGCSEDQTSCLAELGDALGVRRIVIGQVGKVGDSYVVNLRLVQTEQVVVENRVTETYRGREEVLLQAVPHAARKLLGIELDDPGTVVVTSPEAGAEVYVDGVLKGVTPLPPLTGISTGRHELVVKKGHFYDWRSDIYVGPGETASLWTELEKTPDEFYETWWFWTGVSAAGVAAVLGTAAAVGGYAGFYWYENERPHPLTASARLGEGATP